MTINIGFTESGRQSLAQALATLLADTYTLYLKTQGFHWNVTGPHFYTLHGLFESQYNELSEAVDEIAERIRALGVVAPASFQQFSKLTSLQEETKIIATEAMVAQLLQDHEALIKKIRSFYSVTEETGDEGTADLFTERLRAHEKSAWMLRSILA